MNTRFNPTANGRLHLGHMYVILLNYWTAKRNHGCFSVRCDDAQPFWLNLLGRSAIDGLCDDIRRDLDWMGIQPDRFSRESAEQTRVCAYLHNIRKIPPLNPEGAFPVPYIVGCERPYPYVPYQTAAKVVHDHLEGIDCLIRGNDLVSEYGLYCYLCDLLEVPQPVFSYVPKLLHKGDELSDVSKTNGQFKLADLRARGFRPADVEAVLAQSCLLDPGRGWSVENVKQCPRLLLDQW